MSRFAFAFGTVLALSRMVIAQPPDVAAKLAEKRELERRAIDELKAIANKMQATTKVETLRDIGVKHCACNLALRKLLSKAEWAKHVDNEAMATFGPDIEVQYRRLSTIDGALKELAMEFPVKQFDESMTELVKIRLQYLMSMAESYNRIHGTYPDTLEKLAKTRITRLAHITFVKEADLVDAWGRPFLYKQKGARNRNGPDIWSLGPLHRAMNDGMVGNW